MPRPFTTSRGNYLILEMFTRHSLTWTKLHLLETMTEESGISFLPLGSFTRDGHYRQLLARTPPHGLAFTATPLPAARSTHSLLSCHDQVIIHQQVFLSFHAGQTSGALMSIAKSWLAVAEPLTPADLTTRPSLQYSVAFQGRALNALTVCLQELLYENH